MTSPINTSTPSIKPVEQTTQKKNDPQAAFKGRIQGNLSALSSDKTKEAAVKDLGALAEQANAKSILKNELTTLAQTAEGKAKVQELATAGNPIAQEVIKAFDSNNGGIPAPTFGNSDTANVSTKAIA